jgi:hopene-associated glycosyltransferase HpnB
VHALIFPAALALIAWIVLLFVHGGFWRVRVDVHAFEGAAAADPSAALPTVYAVVPARNEAQSVGITMHSLATQRYDGLLRIFLVDDQSEDGTVDVARSALAGMPGEERLQIVRASAPLPGWSGKINAMECGVHASLTSFSPPEYWLFTDADISHDPDNVRTLVEKARRDGLALASLMVRLRCESVWERLLIPAFVFFFQKLYPFAWVNDSTRRTAAAAGGCILLRHDALVRIGGLRAIHDRLIDDCSLAAAVKESGAPIWLGLTDRTSSVRRYETLGEIWSMVKRTAYTQLNHSPLLLAGAVAGMLLIYAIPVVAVIMGAATHDAWLESIGAVALAASTMAYHPTVEAYHRSPGWCLTLPAAALLYTLMTIDSALAHTRKNGGAWKGRTYVKS